MEKQFNDLFEENNFSDTIHRPIAEALCKLIYNKYSLAGGLLNKRTVEIRRKFYTIIIIYIILKEKLLNVPK